MIGLILVCWHFILWLVDDLVCDVCCRCACTMVCVSCFRVLVLVAGLAICLCYTSFVLLGVIHICCVVWWLVVGGVAVFVVHFVFSFVLLACIVSMLFVLRRFV